MSNAEKVTVTFTPREEIYIHELAKVDYKIEELKKQVFICFCFVICFIGLSSITIITILQGGE